MTSELWAVARAAHIEQAIATCRTNPATCQTIAPDFPATYASVAAHRPPGYWNGYLTWVLVQALALERYPQIGYSIRDAAALIRRFLAEPVEEVTRSGPFGLFRTRPRPAAKGVPEVAGLLDLLVTLGGEAAEDRLALLSPNSDPTWSEEGALYFSDAERDRVLHTLPALRALLTGEPHGPRFHFWIIRRPGLDRMTRDILRMPAQFVADIETIFGRARAQDAQVFVLWAP